MISVGNFGVVDGYCAARCVAIVSRNRFCRYQQLPVTIAILLLRTADRAIRRILSCLILTALCRERARSPNHHREHDRQSYGRTQASASTSSPVMWGLPQANIAFWERSEKPPRSDVLPKMAQALGVTVEDLIVGDQKPLKKAAKHNGRPAGRCARFSIASPNYAASRSISSIGLRLRVALRAEQTELTLV